MASLPRTLRYHTLSVHSYTRVTPRVNPSENPRRAGLSSAAPRRESDHVGNFPFSDDLLRSSEIFCIESENQLGWYLHAAVVCCVVPMISFLHIHSNYTDHI